MNNDDIIFFGRSPVESFIFIEGLALSAQSHDLDLSDKTRYLDLARDNLHSARRDVDEFVRRMRATIDDLLIRMNRHEDELRKDSKKKEK